MTKEDEKLYSQNELAKKLHISRGNFSVWLKTHQVQPVATSGQKKLYPESVLAAYRQSKQPQKLAIKPKHTDEEVAKLKSVLKAREQEITELKQEIKQLKSQIADKDQSIKDFAERFATLADQAQKLEASTHVQLKRLTDKEEEEASKAVQNNEESEKKGFFGRLFGK